VKKLISVYPYIFVNGTKVSGVSKIDFRAKTVTCFDPQAYDPLTKTFGNMDISGEISFFIEDIERSSDRYHSFDGTNIINETKGNQVYNSH